MKGEDKARLVRHLDAAKGWARIDTHPTTGGCRRVIVLLWRKHGSRIVEVRRIGWARHLEKDHRAETMVRELRATGWAHKFGIWEKGERIWPPIRSLVVRPTVAPLTLLTSTELSASSPSRSKARLARRSRIPMK